AGRRDARLAAVPAAGALYPPGAPAALPRPEAALVPAAARLDPGAAPVRYDRAARVRPLSLGRLLAAGQGGRLFQAAGVRPRTRRARQARVPGGPPATARLVAAPLAAGADGS